MCLTMDGISIFIVKHICRRDTLVPQSLALSVHRELAASGLDRLMIKIKTARRKLTFIRGEIKELVTDF
jgi:hypothetical protein